MQMDKEFLSVFMALVHLLCHRSRSTHFVALRYCLTFL